MQQRLTVINLQSDCRLHFRCFSNTLWPHFAIRRQVYLSMCVHVRVCVSLTLVNLLRKLPIKFWCESKSCRVRGRRGEGEETTLPPNRNLINVCTPAICGCSKPLLTATHTHAEQRQNFTCACVCLWASCAVCACVCSVVWLSATSVAACRLQN